jgi:putative iron-dependent peroxidase
MFIGRPPGNYDRLLDFSTAVTGTLFFVPSLPLLESLAGPAALAGPAKPGAQAEPPATDGSLRIGNLRT